MNYKIFFYFITPPLIYNFFKDLHKSITVKSILKKLNTEIVLNGPFKGMSYIKDSVGSTLLPKLIGSYEFELNDVIEEFRNHNFNNIIDIGSAEGYYAVGFALNFNYNKVHAFDINSHARFLLNRLSKINNVQEKIEIHSKCDARFLMDFDLSNALILSDCEGFEKELFLDFELFKKLKNAFLIIETHDFIDPLISKEITSLYNNSHEVRIINSIDDLNKAISYKFCDENLFSFNERYLIYKEDRPCIMKWLVLTPKKKPIS